ncbi:MAG: exodeoxyribonuclease VII small subunit [Verrucomicrobiales bacterium]|jgi:exodeoxyribonuclease VII small subunit
MVGALPMAASKSEKLPTNFEDALSQLDTIVEALEQDSVPLADLISQYDRGMKLLETCQTKLEEARQRVSTIGQTDGHEGADEPPAEDANDELF